MSNLSDLIPAGASAKSIEATATATITTKKPVILNSAGTVTQVGMASVALDVPYITTDTAGSVWDATATRTYSSLQFDPLVEGRMLIGYNDATGYPSVIVGEQDGSSITWGVSTVLVSVYTTWSVSVAFDPANTNQILAQYYDATATDIEAVSATITGSGASAAFTLGTAVQLYNGAPVTTGPQCVAFDPSASATALFLYIYSGPVAKLVAATMVGNVITLGTEITAADVRDSVQQSITFNSAGTFILNYISNSTQNIDAYTGGISGTTVTISSAVNVGGGSSGGNSALCNFDPNNDNKAGFAYEISSNATVQIVTLSGAGASATITLGTATTYFSGDIETGGACLFNDSTAGQLVTVYMRGGVPKDIEARAATYDDSSTSNTLTLGTVYTMWDTSATGFPQARYPAGCVNGIFGVTFVRDDDHDGTVVLGKLETQETNLTATNFVGIADAGISTSATGTIIVQGGTVAGLSSLTIGSNYYVQSDGTFATSASTPSVKAGLATSATALLLSGDS